MGFLDFFTQSENSIEQKVDSIIEVEVDFSNFEMISEYIYKKSGIIDLDKRALVFTRLKQFAKDSEIYTTKDFLNKMQSEDSFYQKVMNIVTVNETYFLRETSELNWLVDYVKKLNRRVKILSLPSSSGEEIYSILMMLSMANVDIRMLDMYGYDINSEAVEDAQRGYYNEHSLHKVDKATREKYFTKTSDTLYKISSSFINRTHFSQRNIFEISGDINEFDIILSRNMFIYFNNEKRREAVDVIVGLLKNDGIYIKGHADHIEPHPNLSNVKFGIYKKI